MVGGTDAMNYDWVGRSVLLIDKTKGRERRVLKASITKDGILLSEDLVRSAILDDGAEIHSDWSIIVPKANCFAMALALQNAKNVEPLPDHPITSALPPKADVIG